MEAKSAEKTKWSIPQETEEKDLGQYRELYLQAFAELPNENERSYEKGVLDLSKRGPKELVEKLMDEILRDRQVKESFRYAAYCTAHTLQRRWRNREKLKVLRAAYEEEFKNHPSALHFELLSYVDLGNPVNDEMILYKAEQSVEKMSFTAGAEHLLTDLVVRYFNSYPERVETQEGEKWLKKGLDAVERALLQDDYAKFYYTRARLLTLMREYEEAQRDLRTAMDKEDSSGDDYSIRMATYMSEAAAITAITRADSLQVKLKMAEQNIESQMSKLDESSVKNLEFLGLFAGIISFTIGGINIVSNASQFSFLGAAGLLVVLLGTLLEVFCGFGVVLHGLGKTRENWQRNLAVCAFGIIMIVVGLILCSKAGVPPVVKP